MRDDFLLADAQRFRFFGFIIRHLGRVFVRRFPKDRFERRRHLRIFQLARRDHDVPIFKPPRRFDDHRVLLAKFQGSRIKIVYLAGLLKPDSHNGLHFIFLPNINPLTVSAMIPTSTGNWRSVANAAGSARQAV